MISIAVFVQAFPCSAGTGEVVDRTGRYALHDCNDDGWDDLWQHLFAEIDTTRPGLDEDGDGRTNYEEMLDFADPYRPDAPARELTPAEQREARQAVARARRVSDEEKRRRFQAVLESRGVMVPAPRAEAPADDSGTNPVPAEEKESSYYPDTGVEPLLPCNGGGGSTCPKIIALERLSTGQFLLAWEGESDLLYDIDYSDDLVTWKSGTINQPVVNGVGNWSSCSSSPRRFFRIFHGDGNDTTPSAADGGDGVNTFGGTIEVNYVGTSPSTATVVANLPGGMEPSVVTLFVDGERYSDCWQVAAHTYRAFLPDETWLPGTHTIHAVLCAIFDTPTGEEPALPSPGILRTPGSSVTVPSNPVGWIPLGFRVTEDEISPDEPDLPNTTHFMAEIPPYYSHWFLRLFAPNGEDVVREFDGPIELGEPHSLFVPWDGTDESGSPVPGALYAAELVLGGPGDYEAQEPVLVVVQSQRIWKALCVMAPIDVPPVTPAWKEEYWPEWHSQIDTSAYLPWGPWGKLGSLSTIVEELKDPLGSLGRSGRWKVLQWECDGRYNHADAGDPGAVFEAGGNPFNAHEIGMLMGHGAASSGGAYVGPLGPSLLKPQHHLPIMKDKTTGETVWVQSAEHPKYGATGTALNWMFLMTCNTMRDSGEHDIYNPMIADGSFPFGPDLHVLCGYTTKMLLEGGEGTALTDVLVHGGQGENTVVKAWENMWEKSTNSKATPSKVARAVFWPECENDTIYGVPVDRYKVTEPTGPYDLNRLQYQDFSE